MKRLSATACGLSIGVPNLKAFACETVVKVNFATLEVLKTIAIHGVRYASAFPHLIRIFGEIYRHAILKTRASARLDKDAQNFTVFVFAEHGSNF
jgi:hypothetical protein